jgi:serine/threonine-protein phosphatase 4 regulatory subunit 2
MNLGAPIDILHSEEWPKLRNIIKYKIDEVPPQGSSAGHSFTWSCQNIAAFLADAQAQKSTSIYVPPFSPRPSTNGGLKLPPFPSRERDESNPNEAPKAHFTSEEAAAMKETLFTQLDDFDACVSRPCMSMTPHAFCPARPSRSSASRTSARGPGKTTRYLENIVAH